MLGFKKHVKVLQMSFDSKSDQNSENAIEIEGLSKCYHIYSNPSDRLKQMLSFGRKQFHKEFWAVRDVNFKVKKGETVGILGFNGAGKSTLLQMICGTLNPTHGKVKINGNISALLELGAGFNPEFTGRENVFLSCALYGMTNSEISDRYHEITEFAAIGDFIDQPVKTYSSGMFARLAFSAAVHVNPAVLIVDEALSVGDMAFQEKSINRMKELRDAGTSILFVTHSISVVRNFCNKAIWIENGKIRAQGERLDICDEYQNAVEKLLRREIKLASNVIADEKKLISENQTIMIVSAFADQEYYEMGADIFIEVLLSFSCDKVEYGVGFIIYDSKGNIVSIINTLRDGQVYNEKKEKHKLRIIDHHLAPGEYTITISISDEQAMFSYDKKEHCIRFKVVTVRNKAGLALVEGIVRCEHEWQ